MHSAESLVKENTVSIYPSPFLHITLLLKSHCKQIHLSLSFYLLYSTWTQLRSIHFAVVFTTVAYC